MAFNEKLKEARRRAKLTQKDVEDATGIKITTLSNWENGVSQPDVEKLKTLCDLYGVQPNEIFEWESDPSPSQDAEIRTIAAHHDGEDWTEEELDEVERFKEWVRAKRKQK